VQVEQQTEVQWPPVLAEQVVEHGPVAGELLLAAVPQ
jgi:hypothetical protein